MTTRTTSPLPTWDLTTIYPGPESSEYAASVTSLVAKLDGLERLIGQAEALPDRDGPDVTSVFETLREEADAAFLMAHRNNSFLYGYISVDSRDRVAQAKTSELSLVRAGSHGSRTGSPPGSERSTSTP